MTNDLAIRILTGDVLGTTEQTKEAITMAVRALSKPDVTDTNVGDTISRQAVMKEFSNFVRASNNSDFAPTPTWNDAVSLVESMPSAERLGRWIRTGEDGYCSICNCDMPMYKEDWEWRYLETPYCPNCGARMEVVTE